MKNLKLKCLAIALLSCTLCNAQQANDQAVVTKSFTEPIEQSIVASSEGGVIMKALIEEGDAVAVGQPLAILDNEVLFHAEKIAVARSESTAAREAAASRVELLKAQKETIESLIDGGHVNNYEVQQKHIEYVNALAELKAADDELRLNRIEVDRSRAQLNRRTIKSPINGFVTMIHKQLGEHLSNTEPQYATIVRIDQLKVRFYLDAATLDRVEPGSEVEVLVGDDRTAKMAFVKFVSPVIDPDSGTGRIEVVINNQDLQIRSGAPCLWNNHDAPQSNPARRAEFNLNLRQVR
jgi:RND family efflux transporter MFP subunit